MFVERNRHLVQSLWASYETLAAVLWESYAEDLIERLCLHGQRFSRHLQSFLTQHVLYTGAGSAERQEQDRLAAIQWIVYQGFEETFVPLGRSRVQWRHLPAEDSACWRERAEQAGALFLLAREYLRPVYPNPSSQDKEERNCRAIVLAESWADGENIPTEDDLESLLLVVWYRRCLDIARQLAREEQSHWHKLRSSENEQESATHQALVLDESSALSPSLRPDERLQREQGFSLVCKVFLCVCKDQSDKQILLASLQGSTEQESAVHLGLTRAQVRSRWNTLVNRAQLLFKIVSRAQHPTSLALPSGEQALPQLQHRIQQLAMLPSEKSMSDAFWLRLFQLSVILEHRLINVGSRDQKTSWNALAQTWRRAMEKLLDPEIEEADPPLLRDLVFFWSDAVQLTQASLEHLMEKEDQQLNLEQPSIWQELELG